MIAIPLKAVFDVLSSASAVTFIGVAVAQEPQMEVSPPSILPPSLTVRGRPNHSWSPSHACAGARRGAAQCGGCGRVRRPPAQHEHVRPGQQDHDPRGTLACHSLPWAGAWACRSALLCPATPWLRPAFSSPLDSAGRWQGRRLPGLLCLGQQPSRLLAHRRRPGELHVAGCTVLMGVDLPQRRRGHHVGETERELKDAAH